MHVTSRQFLIFLWFIGFLAAGEAFGFFRADWISEVSKHASSFGRLLVFLIPLSVLSNDTYLETFPASNSFCWWEFFASALLFFVPTLSLLDLPFPHTAHLVLPPINSFFCGLNFLMLALLFFVPAALFFLFFYIFAVNFVKFLLILLEKGCAEFFSSNFVSRIWGTARQDFFSNLELAQLEFICLTRTLGVKGR